MLASALALALAAAPAGGWKALAGGVEYATFRLAEKPAHGDGLLHAVRVDPSKVELAFGLASVDGEARTAGAWADRAGFAVVMNAGMFAPDHRTNEGRLVDGAHVNSARWKPTYRSVLLFNPRSKDVPAAALADRDAPGFEALAAKYGSLVQNLRLVKGEGASVWKPNGRRWSEAMLAQDRAGRLLFLFTRTPFEMAELNRLILALPLGVVRACHAEGGPEASLSIRTKALTLDLAGSFETGFNENDGNAGQWPVPNVVGVRVR